MSEQCWGHIFQVQKISASMCFMLIKRNSPSCGSSSQKWKTADSTITMPTLCGWCFGYKYHLPKYEEKQQGTKFLSQKDTGCWGGQPDVLSSCDWTESTTGLGPHFGHWDFHKKVSPKTNSQRLLINGVPHWKYKFKMWQPRGVSLCPCGECS